MWGVLAVWRRKENIGGEEVMHGDVPKLRKHPSLP